MKTLAFRHVDTGFSALIAFARHPTKQIIKLRPREN